MATYNPIITSVEKIGETALGLTLKAGTSTTPLIYSNNEWQIATTGSTLANALGATGQYSQEAINNFLLEQVAAGVVSIEIVDDHTAVESPSETTLYLEIGSGDNLFTRYMYKSGTWTECGTITLDLVNYIKAVEELTDGNIVIADGTKAVKTTSVSASNLVKLIAEFLGTNAFGGSADATKGSLAKLLYDYSNDNIGGGGSSIELADVDNLGGIFLGFDQDDSNKKYPIKLDAEGRAYVQVPWSGSQQEASATQSGLMNKQEYMQLLLYRSDLSIANEDTLVNQVSNAFNSTKSNVTAFIAPLIIPTSNYLDIATSSAVRTIARVTKITTLDTSIAFKVQFEVGTYNFTLEYNGSSSTLYHEDFMLGDATTDTTFAI